MIKVKHGNSPISPLFWYKLHDNQTGITIDLREFNNKDNHIKVIKNSIIYAILLFHKKNSNGTLKYIEFEAKEKPELLESVLPLIYNQANFFNLKFLPAYPRCFDKPYVFSDEWAKGIKQSISEVYLKNAMKAVDDLNIHGAEKLMYYRTVSDTALQIRYKGYQIFEYGPKKGLVPVNNKQMKSPKKHAEDLIECRFNSDIELYNKKEEHYLESILLDKISTGDLNINNIKISKIFHKSSVYFQFPVLMKPGESTKKKGNTAKYVDVLAKSGDRPVIMELKVWGKRSKERDKALNSRGNYMFSGFSQVLSYCNYLSSVFGKSDTPKEKKEGLEEIYGLRWNEPIIYIIINDIGKDAIAKKFRGYIEQIKKYIITDIELYFVEFEKDPWEKHRKFEVNNII